MKKFRDYIIKGIEYKQSIKDYSERYEYKTLKEIEESFASAFEEDFEEYIDLLISCNCMDILHNNITNNYEVYLREHPMI